MSQDNVRFGSSPGPYRPIEPLDPVTIKLFSTGINVQDGPKDLQDTEATEMNNVRIEKSGIGPDYGIRKLPLDTPVVAVPLTIVGDTQCSDTEAIDSVSEVSVGVTFDLSKPGCTITAKDYFEGPNAFDPPNCSELGTELTPAVASPDWADGLIVGTQLTLEANQDPGSDILYACRFTISDGTDDVFAWLVWVFAI